MNWRPYLGNYTEMNDGMALVLAQKLSGSESRGLSCFMKTSTPIHTSFEKVRFESEAERGLRSNLGIQLRLGSTELLYQRGLLNGLHSRQPYEHKRVELRVRHWQVHGMLKTQDCSGSKGGAKVGALAGAGMHDVWGLLHDLWGLAQNFWGFSVGAPDCAPLLEGLAQDRGSAERVRNLEAPDCAPLLQHPESAERVGTRRNPSEAVGAPDCAPLLESLEVDPGFAEPVGTRRNLSEPVGAPRLRTTFGEPGPR